MLVGSVQSIVVGVPTLTSEFMSACPKSDGDAGRTQRINTGLGRECPTSSEGVDTS
jgi:hypothetical protein